MTLRALSLVGYALIAGAFAGLVLLHAVASRSPVVIGVQAAGVALVIWARVVFGRRSLHAAADPTAGGLVTTGPYRLIRHPIYTGACLIVGAGVAAHASPASLSLGLVLLAGALVRMLCEERLVRARYPEYEAYARATKRMIPYVF